MCILTWPCWVWHCLGPIKLLTELPLPIWPRLKWQSFSCSLSLYVYADWSTCIKTSNCVPSSWCLQPRTAPQRQVSPSLRAELNKLAEDIGCGSCREPHLIPALLFPCLCVCSVFILSPLLIQCWDSTFSGLHVSRIFRGCGVSHQEKSI